MNRARFFYVKSCEDLVEFFLRELNAIAECVLKEFLELVSVEASGFAYVVGIPDLVNRALSCLFFLELWVGLSLDCLAFWGHLL